MSQKQIDRNKLTLLSRKKTNLIGSMEEIYSTYEIAYETENNKQNKRKKSIPKPRNKDNKQGPVSYEMFSKDKNKNKFDKNVNIREEQDPNYYLDSPSYDDNYSNFSEFDSNLILSTMSYIIVRGE